MQSHTQLAYGAWRAELAVIERKPITQQSDLDATRACIIRACMRSAEIDLINEHNAERG